MSKSKKNTAAKKDGPYLAAALFCETILQDKNDETLSAIRIVDCLKIALPPHTPAELPSKDRPIPVAVTLLLIFRSGDNPGEHEVRIDIESPTGEKKAGFYRQRATFTGPENGGHNFRVNILLGAIKGGLFWFDVYVDDKRMTRMPYRVEVTRGEPVTPPPQPANGKPRPRKK
jgi:hypothetical protein